MTDKKPDINQLYCDVVNSLTHLYEELLAEMVAEGDEDTRKSAAKLVQRIVDIRRDVMDGFQSYKYVKEHR